MPLYRLCYRHNNPNLGRQSNFISDKSLNGSTCFVFYSGLKVWAYGISHCRDQSARLEAGFACLGVLLCLPEMFVPLQRAAVFQVICNQLLGTINVYFIRCP